jgi:hypothetical protein
MRPGLKSGRCVQQTLCVVCIGVGGVHVCLRGQPIVDPRVVRGKKRAEVSREEGTLLTVGVGSGLLRHKHTAGCLNRPHGQHAVVLAEDAHRFTAYRSDHRGEDLSGINPSSRQIYLTFPAESTFTEEDVTSHFRFKAPAYCFHAVCVFDANPQNAVLSLSCSYVLVF